MSALPHDETTIDLMCEHAARGLEPEHHARLTAALPDASVLDEFDHAAAALSVALLETEEPLPSSLRTALAEEARRHDRGEAGPTLRLTADDEPDNTPPAGVIGAIGWMLAAACLLVGAVVMFPKSPAASSLEDEYAALSARPDVVTASWIGLDDLLGVAAHANDLDLQGEVIWDPETQTGYMKFTGLAANNPDEFQYQLWIFDAERRIGDLPQFAIDGLPPILTQRPVDGGVFDASTADQIIVPINAKLPVGTAAIFAITVEPPGGVVVSDRDIVTAAIPG